MVYYLGISCAGIAQLVEQLICNQQVGGSSPSTSSKQIGNMSVRMCFLFIFLQKKGLEPERVCGKRESCLRQVPSAER